MSLSGILDFVRSFGTTSIEVYEWNEGDVRTRRLPNSPNFRELATQHPNLTFSGWDLAHAIVKADYLDQRNLTMPGLGFLLQSCNLIDFGTGTITLKPGASEALNDFSLTSLSGRVGQGLALLYGQSLGMMFTAHLRSYVESQPPNSVAATQKKNAMADFLFASAQNSVLVESKGSFTLKENDPTAIKSVLRRALVGQIDPWMDYLDPTPSNGYVVYSCLRENSWCPSALFVVDPEGDDDASGTVPLSYDQVLRENYGAWLRAMGLWEAARRLVRRPHETNMHGEPIDIPFFIFELSGRRYAFRADMLDLHPDSFIFVRPYQRIAPPVVGIDLAILKTVSAVIQNPEGGWRGLPQDLPQQGSESQGEYSIFPDGSILANLRARPFDEVFVRL